MAFDIIVICFLISPAVMRLGQARGNLLWLTLLVRRGLREQSVSGACALSLDQRQTKGRAAKAEGGEGSCQLLLKQRIGPLGTSAMPLQSAANCLQNRRRHFSESPRIAVSKQNAKFAISCRRGCWVKYWHSVRAQTRLASFFGSGLRDWQSEFSGQSQHKIT